MQSIMQHAENGVDERMLSLHLESLSTVAEFAADDILGLMDAKAEEQWDGEYALAHL